MTTEWPRCDARSVPFDIELNCVLPKGHLMDGQQMHEDKEGHQWIITLTMEDGTEQRL